MKKLILTAAALIAAAASMSAQTYELLPFGDFESWTTRNIVESKLIGGQVKMHYVVGPNEVITENAPYDYSKTIWTGSNAYAVVAGITKVNVSAVPEEGPTGLCAKLETGLAQVTVLGVVNVKVVSPGSVQLGKTHEPITSLNEPNKIFDWGIPFTKRPKALVLDIRADIPQTGKVCTGGNKFVDAEDPAGIDVILQNRTEDSEGNIHTLRVGTGIVRIEKSTDGWKHLRIPIIYGDATKSTGYRGYMKLITGKDQWFYTNSKGNIVPIPEEGWAAADAPVTHLFLSICSSTYDTVAGQLGNTVRVDNVMFEY